MFDEENWQTASDGPHKRIDSFYHWTLTDQGNISYLRMDTKGEEPPLCFISFAQHCGKSE